jgi:hypothetical protein
MAGNKKRILKAEFIYRGIDLDGSIDRVIEDLIEIRDRYTKKGYENIMLDYDKYRGSYFNIYGDRPETDAEYKKRTENTEKKEKQEKDKRKQMYEKLKKEFEQD